MDTNANNISDVKYSCPVEVTIKRIGGKWKSVILWWLRQSQKSFGELKHLIPSISSKVLTQQLRELEEDRLVHRETYREVPRRVEYFLTSLGETLIPIVDLMCDWGKEQLPSFQSGLLDLQVLRMLLMSSEIDNILRSELESRGIKVAIATSSTQALAIFEQFLPQALVIDTDTPKVFNLISQIKKLELSHSFAAIALTNPSSSSDRRLAFRSGFQICLTKPIETSELVAALASLTGTFNQFR